MSASAFKATKRSCDMALTAWISSRPAGLILAAFSAEGLEQMARTDTLRDLLLVEYLGPSRKDTVILLPREIW